MLKILIISLIIHRFIECYKNGAPCSAQYAMRPNTQFHGLPKDYNQSTIPYYFSITGMNDQPTTYYRGNEIYTVRLYGVRTYFRGFIMQARLATQDRSVIGHLRSGEFRIEDRSADYYGIKFQQCPPLFNDSLTHSDNKEKKFIEVKWRTKRNDGPVQFMLTIVRDQLDYWIDWKPETGFLLPDPNYKFKSQASKKRRTKTQRRNPISPTNVISTTTIDFPLLNDQKIGSSSAETKLFTTKKRRKHRRRKTTTTTATAITESAITAKTDFEYLSITRNVITDQETGSTKLLTEFPLITKNSTSSRIKFHRLESNFPPESTRPTFSIENVDENADENKITSTSDDNNDFSRKSSTVGKTTTTTKFSVDGSRRSTSNRISNNNNNDDQDDQNNIEKTESILPPITRTENSPPPPPLPLTLLTAKPNFFDGKNIGGKNFLGGIEAVTVNIFKKQGHEFSHKKVALDPCLSSPCKNSGKCVVDPSDGGYTCNCIGKWTGFDCAQYDFCHGVDCKNGGTCLNDESSYKCECDENHTGSHCQTYCPASLCQNDAKCVADDQSKPFCECLPGFTGARCETDINECESNPCVDGATCEDGQNGFHCLCPKGYMGDRCHRPCQDIYKSCSFWKEQDQCELRRPSTNFFDVNCAVSCEQCSFDNKTILTDVPLPPALEPIGFLLGTWYLNTTDFRRIPVNFANDSLGYYEQIVFDVPFVPMFGSPSVNFSSFAVKNGDMEDKQQMFGFMTVKSTANPMPVNLMTTGNTGITMMEEGYLKDGQIHLELVYISSMSIISNSSMPIKVKRTLAANSGYLLESISRVDNRGNVEDFVRYFNRKNVTLPEHT